MRTIYLTLAFCWIFIYSHGQSQTGELLREIKFSESQSLVLRHFSEAIGTPPENQKPGAVTFVPTKEIYTVSVKRGNVETEVDRFEFRGISHGEPSAAPRFAVYDAATDNGRLYYLFTEKGAARVGTVQLDNLDRVVEHHHAELPQAVSNVSSAAFSRDQNNKLILAIKQRSGKPTAFRFDANGTITPAVSE